MASHRLLRRGRDRGSIAASSSSSSSSSSSILAPCLRRRRPAFTLTFIFAAALALVCLPGRGAAAAAAAAEARPSLAFLPSRGGMGTGRRRVGGSEDAARATTIVSPPSGPRPHRPFLGGVVRRDQSSKTWRMSASRENQGVDEEEGTKKEKEEEEEDGGGVEGGIYRPYASHAWDRISDSGLFDEEAVAGAAEVPEDLRGNSSPAKGPNLAEGTTVEIEIRSAEGRENNPVRLARYALLETLTPPGGSGGGGRCVPDAIHVLNLVVFPSPDLRLVASTDDKGEEKEEEEGEELALPVLGIDLVTLPGGKHLVAIDLQPVLPQPPPEEEEDEGEEVGEKRRLLHPRYASYEDRLAALHEEYCGTGAGASEEPHLPWGGDVPPAASRYFSPYAVWTRLSGQEGLNKVTEGGVVWEVFREYLELYLELMGRVRKDVEAGTVVASVRVPPSEDGPEEDDGVEEDDGQGGEEGSEGEGEGEEGALEGQRSYLNYRRANDPARPMLRRLYGEEWTERLIEEVLFRDV